MASIMLYQLRFILKLKIDTGQRDNISDTNDSDVTVYLKSFLRKYPCFKNLMSKKYNRICY